MSLGQACVLTVFVILGVVMTSIVLVEEWAYRVSQFEPDNEIVNLGSAPWESFFAETGEMYKDAYNTHTD